MEGLPPLGSRVQSPSCCPAAAWPYGLPEAPTTLLLNAGLLAWPAGWPASVDGQHSMPSHSLHGFPSRTCPASPRGLLGGQTPFLHFWGQQTLSPLPRTCPMEPKPLPSCPNPCIPAGLGHPPLCPLPQPGTELATGQGSAGSVEKQPKALECGVRPPPPTPQVELTVKAPGPSPLLGVSSGSRSALGGTAAALKEARACRHRLPPARAPIWVGRSSAHAECLQGGL